jgi:hypothetical protein
VSDQAVLIAAGDLLPALKARLSSEASAIGAFTDAEALRALEAITTRRPHIVLLERGFAVTPRGAALMNRIKADPSLAQTVIRIVAPDGTVAHDAGSGTAAAAAVTGAAAAGGSQEHAVVPRSPGQIAAEAPAAAAPDPAAHLDYRGTRRSPRVRVAGALEMMVDGNRGSVIDLSMHGAQVVMPSVLKPNQRVRVSLTDETGTIRCGATVVWASFEIPKGSSPRYRVGVEFIDPDTAAIEACQQRHRES